MLPKSNRLNNRSALRPSLYARLSSVDFKSIQLVVECAERGSLMAAADHCCFTVSAASRRLRMLEMILELKIFDRKPTGLQLTEAGGSVVSVCRKILDSVNSLFSSEK